MTTLLKTAKFLIRPYSIMAIILFLIASYYYFDRSIVHMLATHPALQLLYWLNLLTKFGNIYMYVMILSVLGCILHYCSQHKIWEQRVFFLLMCTIAPNIICLILKVIFSRARPILWLQEHKYGFYWLKLHTEYWSFPSGHTTTIMGFVLGLSVLFPRHSYKFIALGILIAISRIVLLKHYLSDVVIAMYLTLLEIGFLLYIMPKISWFNRLTGKQS